jgi:hypothetical protein
MPYRSLTDLAQHAISQVLRPGDCAIDATLGNGHDALFLTERVGLNGRLFGFDLQQQAIDATRQRLRHAGYEQCARLYCASHATLHETLSAAAAQPPSAVMFNLGYLPGGDKHLVTLPESSCAAVRQACSLLAEGGLITVLSYRGHTGGQDEYYALEKTLRELNRQGFDISRESVAAKRSDSAPMLFLIHHNPGV